MANPLTPPKERNVSARSMWETYLIRTGADSMYRQEGTYHYQLNFLRETLERIEVVLQDEGLPPDQVERILRSILYGTPSKTDAEERIRMREEMTRLAMQAPSPLMSDQMDWGRRERAKP